MEQKNASVYIATLGFAPQVVTLGLYGVKHRMPDENIERVIVVHTSTPEIHEHLERLREAFQSNEFLSDFRFETQEILMDGKPVKDILTVKELEAAFKTIFGLIRAVKSEGYRVHFNIAGSRKTLSVVAAVAAQMLFDDRDHAWYLISDEELMNAKSFLPDSPEQIELVEIPIIPWSDVDPLLTVLVNSENPLEDRELYKELYRRRKKRTIESFFKNELTRGEREVLREVVLRGGSNREIAGRLKKSPRTVEHQLQAIYRKLKEFFAMPAETRLRRDFLVREFGHVIRENR